VAREPPGDRERMVDKTIFTLNEVAELLGCHVETLRREIRSGSLRAAKIGKDYRVSKTDLEEYWATKGGGALFVDSPRIPFEPPKKKEKRPKGQEQLKLPT
jgi:excisionase family DNA binding protein